MSLCRIRSRIGDNGHFLQCGRTIYLNSPAGEAFDIKVTLAPMGTLITGEDNPIRTWPDLIERYQPLPERIRYALQSVSTPLTVLGPNGDVVLQRSLAELVSEVEVPGGQKGVYEVIVSAEYSPGSNELSSCQHTCYYVETSVEQAVLSTGDAGERVVNGPRDADAFCRGWGRDGFWAKVIPILTRRWYFYVPEGTTSFSAFAVSCGFARQDVAMSIITPRGRRFNVLWNLQLGNIADIKDSRTPPPVEVPVEPGYDGRFWAVEFCNAENYLWPAVYFSLRGIPPFISPSAEQWFNPATGERPEARRWDFSRWRAVEYRVMPPIGADSNYQIPVSWFGEKSYWFKCGQRFYVNNWDNTEILAHFVVLNLCKPDARITVRGPGGRVLHEQRVDYGTVTRLYNEWGVDFKLPAGGPGLYELEVEPDAERCSHNEYYLGFYPAGQAVVWTGNPKAIPKERLDHSEGRWLHFICTVPRNWYFFIPEGTEKFGVRAWAPEPDESISLDVYAPDRKMALIYSDAKTVEERFVRVPRALDGKTWFLRLGAADTCYQDGAPKRWGHGGVSCYISLECVPPYLSPTVEQWFLPRTP